LEREEKEKIDMLVDVLRNVPDKNIARLEKKVNKLAEVVGQQFKILDSLRSSIKVLAGFIGPIRGAMELIGEQRMEDCVYCRNGYCEHIARAIPESELSEEQRDTTQKDGKYYPRVDWATCYVCTKYEVPPSYVEKEKKE